MLGQFRSSILAAVLGTSHLADLFYLAFKIPNLFRRVLAEGAMSAVFIPIFNRLPEKATATTSTTKSENSDELSPLSQQEFFSLIFLALGAIVFTLVVVMVFLAPTISRYLFIITHNKDPQQVIQLTRLIQIMMPYLGWVSFSSLCQSVLQSKGRFGIPAFVPILFNLVIITVGVAILFLPLERYIHRYKLFYFSEIDFLKTVLLALSVVIGGFFQWLYPWWIIRKIGYRTSLMKAAKTLARYWKDPIFSKFFKLMIPILFSSGIYQINVLLVDPISLSIEEGAVAFLFYSNRLLELPLGIIAIAINTVSLPLLSKYSDFSHPEQKEKFKKITFRSIRLLFLCLMPILFISIFFRMEIISLLFKFGKFDQNAIEKTAECFLFHILSLPAIFFYRLFYQIFYAKNNTKTPLIAAGLALITSLSMSFYLVDIRNEPSSIALASSLSAYVVMFFLFWELRKYDLNLGKKIRQDALTYIAIMILPSIITGIAYYLTKWKFEELFIEYQLSIWSVKFWQLCQISLSTLFFLIGYFLILKITNRLKY